MSLILLLKASQSTNIVENLNFSDEIIADIIPAVNHIYSCAMLPPIQILQAISAGKHSFANTLIGYNFLVYTTDNSPTNIVGTYTSTNNVFNTVQEELGNQPVFVQKDNSQDCVFNPVIQFNNGYITMAWLESNIYGRLDLRYGDTPVTSTLIPGSVSSSSIYLRPYISETQSLDFESNLPLNKISVVDSLNDIFNLAPSEGLKNGFTLQLPSVVKVIRFTQTFKIMNANINSLFTTVPTTSYETGLVSPIPLIGVVLNVYSGNTAQSLVTRQFSNEFGEVNFTLISSGEYLFEIEVSGNNIFYQQQIL